MAENRRLHDLEEIISEVLATQARQQATFDQLLGTQTAQQRTIQTMQGSIEAMQTAIGAMQTAVLDLGKTVVQLRTEMDESWKGMAGLKQDNQRLNSLFLDLLEVLRRQDDAQDEVRYTLANHEQRLHKLEEPGTDDYPKPQ